MDVQPLADAKWVGWVKPADGTWQAVAFGDDHGQVWAKLLDFVVTSPHAERLLLPRGQHPTTRRARR